MKSKRRINKHKRTKKGSGFFKSNKTAKFSCQQINIDTIDSIEELCSIYKTCCTDFKSSYCEDLKRKVIEKLNGINKPELIHSLYQSYCPKKYSFKNSSSICKAIDNRYQQVLKDRNNARAVFPTIPTLVPVPKEIEGAVTLGEHPDDDQNLYVTQKPSTPFKPNPRADDSDYGQFVEMGGRRSKSKRKRSKRKKTRSKLKRTS